MLCAGLEAAFLQGPQSATAALRWPSLALGAILLQESPPWGHDPAFMQESKKLSVPLRAESALVRRAFEQQRDLDADFRSALMASMRSAGVKGIDLATHWRDSGDAEDWLNISEAELDVEMQRRQEEFDRYDKKHPAKGAGGEAAGKAAATAAEATPDKLPEELASMGREISAMLERASCLDGVEAAKATPAGDQAASGAKAEVSDSDSEGSEDVDVLGMEDGPENESGDEDDSDGEQAAEGGFTEEEMHKYMAALDEQLEETEEVEEPDDAPRPKGDEGLPLTSHHVKVNLEASEPLELDLHAMEHLLASYCSEHHLEPGPASLLLGELGLAGGGGYGHRGVVAGASLDSMD